MESRQDRPDRLGRQGIAAGGSTDVWLRAQARDERLGRVPGRTAAAFARGDSTMMAVGRGVTSKEACRRGFAATEESVRAGGELSSNREPAWLVTAS